MKRLVLLAVLVTVVTSATVGCQCRLFGRRGAKCSSILPNLGFSGTQAPAESCNTCGNNLPAQTAVGGSPYPVNEQIIGEYPNNTYGGEVYGDAYGGMSTSPIPDGQVNRPVYPAYSNESVVPGPEFGEMPAAPR